MLFVVLSSLLLLATSEAADYCSSYGGVCSNTACSRYFLPPNNLQLCPSLSQRCCVSEVCLTRFNGNCQSGLLPCYGARYTHYGTTSLCQKSTDVCCISKSPVITTARPTRPVSIVKKEPCSSLGGNCQERTRSCSGEYKLLGEKSQVLCSNWYQGNERCCLPASTVTRPNNPGSGPSTNSPSKQTCGVQKVKLMHKRIIGGNTAEKGEWPWQVSIIKSSYSSYYGRRTRHACGGTLIAPQWVVSAAHCFTDVSSSYSIRVRVGEHSFLMDEGTESDNQVVDIVRYPTYSKVNNKNDIALVKLAKPVDLNSQYINTACLAESKDLTEFYRTQDCYTTGWGYTRGTSESGGQTVLQEVKSSLVDQSSCYRKWGYKIDNTKVCFGNGYKGACMGDSGGPLVCKKSGVFYLVGVVSYGSESCTDRYVPTVYTSVAAYNQWINSIMATR